MRERHNVYVIELDKDVLYEAKFKRTNPKYVTGKPRVYLGMTGHDPDTRFDQHKAGACPKFLVNGLVAGNCLHLQRKRNDRKQRTDRPPVGGLQKA